jgi:hypothetical protein
MNTPPPSGDQVVDKDGFMSLSWLLFNNGIYEGDTGTDWTPAFTSLTQTGTPTITGRYYRVLRRLCFFRVLIVPGTDTTSTAGTTYINNFPLTFTSDGVCFAVSGNLGATPGHIVASNNRIYVPAWTAVTVPLTVIGIGEVSS